MRWTDPRDDVEYRVEQSRGLVGFRAAEDGAHYELRLEPQESLPAEGEAAADDVMMEYLDRARGEE